MAKRKFTPIKVRKGAVGLLAEMFGCSRFYVNMALTRDVDRPLYNKIREAAKEYAPEPAPPRARVRAKNVAEIAERAGCSSSAVYKALRGIGGSPLFGKIRTIAQEYAITPCGITVTRRPMKRITVRHGAIREIAERMGCSYYTVYRALHGEVRNELADNIRKAALAYVKRKDAEPIKVRHGGVIELAKRFGCNVEVVMKALKGSQISPLEMAIREAAKDYTGKEELPKMFLKFGGGKALCDTFGCSLETVRLALNGKLASPLAKAIRGKAVELGLTRDADEPSRKGAPKCEPLGFALRCGAITEIAKVCNVPASFASKVVRGSAVFSERAEKVLTEASKPEYRKPDFSDNAPIRLEFNGIPKLAKEFGCSTSMVKKSLSWKTNTELAIAIRRKAEKMKEEADAIYKQLKPLKVKKGAITTLAQVFGCHYNTAYFAINGLSKSDLCREIRAKAYELGLVMEKQ